MSSILDSATVPSTTNAASLSQTISASASATSAKSFLPSSPLELITFPLRVLNQAETFAFSTVPRHLLRIAGIDNIQMNFWGGAAATASDAGFAGDAAQAATDLASDGAQAAAFGDSWYVSEFLMAAKKIGGFFGYLTSVWSFACLVEALVLNRITIYASTRRHLRLGWERRLALRLIPIVLFATQILSLLRGIRCQTAPSYSTMRYGRPGKPLIFDYAPGGGTLYWLSSNLLSWETDEQACSAVNMARMPGSQEIPYGTFSLLWPTFLLLCLSHFMETLSCALQGKPVMTETGMSIFEHSLAFAEAESMISKSIGLGLFGLPKQSPLNSATSGGDAPVSPLRLLTRAEVLDRMNVTPELLLIVLISCSNSLSSHVLDVLGKQSRYRLFNTALWGLCFMAAMSWGLESGPPVSIETGVLKFPTVCIVGFIPHLLVLLGIIVCLGIYGLALTITAFSLPADETQNISLRQRFALAHENMQGANQIRSIRINRHEDFYTTLLRIGYVALTAASEAVFLNEGTAVIARQMTWLEKDRLAEIEASRQRNSYGNWPNQSRGSPFDAVGYSGFDLPMQSAAWESGYGREKKPEKPKDGARHMRPHAEIGGVGAVQASLRLWHVISFFRSIFWLVVRWIAYGANRALDRLGISARPQWLKRFSRNRQDKSGLCGDNPPGLDFWILTDDGELELPDDREYDVELEMRKRFRPANSNWERNDETRLEDKLYDWWKIGGSWGNQDHTSDYNPSVVDDDDTTSMISMSTNASEDDWEDEADDGRTLSLSFSREGTPLQDPVMDMGYLARLLDPQDSESREEARILAAHLKPGQSSGGIMTRSQYHRQVERERSRVLFSSRLQMESNSQGEKRKPTAEEESDVLERLILSRRAETSSSADPNTWQSGAMGLGENGPPCVVCQSNPRSIITWPCRCLCICEDCRVGLAMSNFGTCVTCRQEVGGFMRLWVP
ncbi:hypothetical protein N7450_010500 [Penicillium hetheringtonii]|uniref:Ubiquitin-protein ligase n=1 Tax=Penicillium hetheringtonii TaxID=911720 RepID=A0AAD6D850_9EURO|nr:hypothetical protein N7450_010500 [Penicillium hetheringtonii]